MVGDDGWWSTHWEQAPAEIADFLAEDGIELAGRSVADLGCGDGIMAAGLAHMTGASVVGFDMDPTDRPKLEDEASARGHDLSSLALQFRKATSGSIDAEDAEFDVGVSWSVMEHVFDRAGYLREARRVIKPNGHLFVQAWPLWHSEHGHHLFGLLKPFDQLRHARDAIVEKVSTLQPGGVEPDSNQQWTDYAMSSYDSCSRVTLDEIQAMLVEHGFGIGRVEVMTSTFHMPADLQSVPLTSLAVTGIKLTCWRKP